MKKYILILLLGAAALSAQIVPMSGPSVLTMSAATGLIPVAQSPTPEPAEIVAQTIVDAVNAQVPIRVAALKNVWETLWENPRATPQEIFNELGPNGALVLLAGSLCVADLENIADAIGKTFAELVGDEKYYTTKHPVNVNQDGTVTVTMPED